MVVGPTASGKSEIALELARRSGAEIASLDSMQVYRGMDIGTAKPSPSEQAAVPHHLIDLAEPEEDFSAARFQAAGRAALDSAAPMILAGGSGLHMRAIVDPLEFPPSDPQVRAAIDALDDDAARAELLAADPNAAEVLDLANPRRVQRAVEIVRLTGRTPSSRHADPSAAAVREYRPLIDFVAVGVDPGDGLEERAARRLEAMIDAGLLDEVAGLRHRLGRTAAQAVGYKELLPVVDGELSVDEGVAAAIRATVALAKRQRTFFRRDPRIRWIDWDDDPQVRLERAAAALRGEGAWTS